MKKCDKSTEIVAFLRGEIPEGERPGLQDHFEKCTSCSTELSRLDRVIKALGKMETVEPSSDFTWRVRQAFLKAHPEFLRRQHKQHGRTKRARRPLRSLGGAGKEHRLRSPEGAI